MAGEDRSIVSLANPAVQSCWLCGTRLPAREMVADGGSACADLRWYCADTRRCTERWTSRWSPGIGTEQGYTAHGRSAAAAPGRTAAGELTPSASAGQSPGALAGHGSGPGGEQNSGAFPGQGASALPRRGAVPGPRGRQLAG